MEIAINVNSAGGGVLLTYNDLFQIKGVMDVFNKAEEYRIAQQLDEAARCMSKPPMPDIDLLKITLQSYCKTAQRAYLQI